MVLHVECSHVTGADINCCTLRHYHIEHYIVFNHNSKTVQKMAAACMRKTKLKIGCAKVITISQRYTARSLVKIKLSNAPEAFCSER